MLPKQGWIVQDENVKQRHPHVEEAGVREHAGYLGPPVSEVVADALHGPGQTQPAPVEAFAAGLGASLADRGGAVGYRTQTSDFSSEDPTGTRVTSGAPVRHWGWRGMLIDVRTTLQDKVSGRIYRLKRRAAGRRAGERILRQRFRDFTGYEFELENAQSLTEKLFRRMILMDRHHDATLTPYVDKIAVRNWVAETIGERYTVPLLWSGRRLRDAPLKEFELPVVLKANHSSGLVSVITPDTDLAALRRHTRRWLKDSLYWEGREYQYHPIERKLFIEPFLDDGFDDGPLDYRFWCFHGVVEFIQLDNHTHSINAFFDVEWNQLDLTTRPGKPRFSIDRPVELPEMLKVAARLSAGFPFVRVDLYNIAGRVAFGELTFTPAGGRIRFEPSTWDHFLGAKW